MTRSYGAPLQVLPGQSAALAMWRSLRWMLIGVVSVLALTVQSFVPRQGLWVVAWLALALGCVVLFVRDFTRAHRKEEQELARGYTTMLEPAVRDPALHLLDPWTLQVLSAPGEARPPDVRRPTVQAWLAERGSRSL